MEQGGWILQFRRERERNGISRKAVAAVAGASREYLCRVETGKMPLTDQMQKRLAAALKALYPEPLNLMIDYVRIRFSTMDVRHIIEDVLRLKMKYFVQEDHGFYSYSSMYVLGDVTVRTYCRSYTANRRFPLRQSGLDNPPVHRRIFLLRTPAPA